MQLQNRGCNEWIRRTVRTEGEYAHVRFFTSKFTLPPNSLNLGTLFKEEFCLKLEILDAEESAYMGLASLASLGPTQSSESIGLRRVKQLFFDQEI